MSNRVIKNPNYLRIKKLTPTRKSKIKLAMITSDVENYLTTDFLILQLELLYLSFQTLLLLILYH